MELTVNIRFRHPKQCSILATHLCIREQSVTGSTTRLVHYKISAEWPKSEIGKSYTPFSHFRCLSCIQNDISLHISSQLQNADENNQNQTNKLLQVTGSFWYLYKFAQLKLEALFDHVQEMLDDIKEVFLLCLFLTCASLLYMFETAEQSYSW